MKSLKLKLAITFSLIALFCGIFAVGTTLFNTNFSYNAAPETSNTEAEYIPDLKSAKALPESSDEVYNSVPSKETLNNLPDYINKTIELSDKESNQTNNNQDVNNNNNSNNNSSLLGFGGDEGEVDHIYAVISKDSQEGFFNLKLQVDFPERSQQEYEKCFEIYANSTEVPGYVEEYATKIKHVDIFIGLNRFYPVSTKQWFGTFVQADTPQPFSNIESINGLSTLNMSRVKDASFMFSGTSKLKSLYQSDRDYIYSTLSFSSLEKSTGMFIGSGLDNDVLNGFFRAINGEFAPNLKNCQYMFTYCKDYKNLNATVNLPNVDNASGMFMRSGLESFDDNIKFGNKIYSVAAMFYECESLKTCNASSMLEQGTSYFNVMDGSQITYKLSVSYSMFEGCVALETADFGKWNFSTNSGATHINYTFEMFSNCKSLRTIFARYDADWSRTIVESNMMFAGCASLIGQNRTTYIYDNMQYAHIDEGKTNPGYFTISKNSSGTPPNASVIFNYDDSIVKYVTDVTKWYIYYKNEKIDYGPDHFKFRVIMRDYDSLPRVFDGVNEIFDEDGVFTIDNSCGCHRVEIDRQTKLKVNFDIDQEGVDITDENGNVVSNPTLVTLNGNLKFKVKYNNTNYVIKEVKVDDQVIEADNNNCYTIKNITNHININIVSQESNKLHFTDEGKEINYYPVFDALSLDNVKFYDSFGQLIHPTSKGNYVMSDLKNAYSYTGHNYKFRAIRIDQNKWDDLFKDVVDHRATNFKRKFYDDETCQALSYSKDKNIPSINGFSLAQIVDSYGIQSMVADGVWGPDTDDEDHGYTYSLDKGWQQVEKTAQPDERSVIIENDCSDSYSVKFDCDSGVKQIVQIDDAGKEIDITNGVLFNKSDIFKFRVKCVDDKGIDNIFYKEVGIGGHDYEQNNLLLDNNSLTYKIFGSSFKHLDTSTCVIKACTTNVSSFKTDKGLYHPVFDNEDPEKVKFYDNDGQCLTPTKRYPGDDYDKYIMNDATYATKYKFIQANDNEEQKIHAVRTIKEDYWEHIFTRKDTGDAQEFTEEFKNKLSEGDTAIKFPKSMSPDVKQISLHRIYEAYKNTGFGHNGSFNYWTNSLRVTLDNSHFGAFFNSYDLDETGIPHYYYNDNTYYNVSVDNCFMVVEREFVKTDPSCTVEFHKDDGVEKITDMRDEEIQCDKSILVRKSDNFEFHVYYKDDHVEKQVTDGVVPLSRNKENNTYTVSSINNKRVVDVRSQGSCSLQSPETSKHKDIMYMPVFDTLDVNNIMFYDKDGHFIEPQNSDKITYKMEDLKDKDLKYFIPLLNVEFDTVATVDSSWNEAFGEETQGKAEMYVGDELDYNDMCYTLGFNYGDGIKIGNVAFDRIRNCYFPKEHTYLGNEANPDNIYTYEYVDSSKEGKWYNDGYRYARYVLVFGKSFKSTYNINIAKDEGIDKVIDDKGNDITNISQIQLSPQLRFRVIYKRDFINKDVKVNGESLKIGPDGYYTINNITSDLSLVLSSDMSKISPLIFGVGRDRYYPIGNNLSFNDIQFYDNNDEIIKPSTGTTYSMEDLITATGFSCKNDFKFTAVRTVNKRSFNDVYSFWFCLKNSACYPLEKFTDTLNNGDQVFLFSDPNIDPPEEPKNEPLINGIGIQQIYNAYKNDNFCPSKGLWSNFIRVTHPFIEVENYYTKYWDCDKSKMDETDGDIEEPEGIFDVLITREFSNNQIINFDKDDSVECIIDEKGNVLGDSVNNPRGQDFKFKIKFKEGHAVDEVFLNGETISHPAYEPDSDDNYFYKINSNLMDNKIRVTSKNALSLKYGDNLYHPIINKDSGATLDNILFYNSDGQIIIPKDSSIYDTSILTEAACYVMLKDNFRFKAVRMHNETWSNAFGEDVREGSAEKYNNAMPPGDVCTTLGFHNGQKPVIYDATSHEVPLNLLSVLYPQAGNDFWTADCQTNNAFKYYKKDDDWSFKSDFKTNENTIVFDRFFGSKSINVNISYDSNIDKVTDIYDNPIDNSFQFTNASELKFKVKTKDGYLLTALNCNNTRLVPNEKHEYTINHPEQDLNIVITSDVSHSLICDDRLYRPLFDALPVNQVRFYDKDDNLIPASGNSGFSYLMSDLKEATKFTSKDYSFDAVCVQNTTFNAAFNADSGVGRAITHKIPNLDVSETVASLGFELDHKPYVSNKSVNDIVNIYYNDGTETYKKFWTPFYDKNHAKAYNIDGSIFIDEDRDNTNCIALHKTFSNIKSVNVNFTKNENVDKIIDNKGNEVPSTVQLVPGQEFLFKAQLQPECAINKITFCGRDINVGPDGYYYIMVDSSLIKESLSVDIIALKVHSLSRSYGTKTYDYKPIFESISSDDVKFYDKDGNYIMPSGENNTYKMSDLRNVALYSGSSYSFDAVAACNLTWKQVFGDMDAGIADKSIMSFGNNQWLTTLDFPTDKSFGPQVNNIRVNDINNAYFGGDSGINHYWTRISIDSDKAALFTADNDRGTYSDEAKDNAKGFLLKTTFSSIDKHNVKITKDKGAKSLIDRSEKEITDSSIDLEPGEDFKFKIVTFDNYVVDKVSVNNSEMRRSADGYYHLLNDSSKISQSLEISVTTKQVIPMKINGIAYRPLIATNDKSFTKDVVEFYTQDGIFIEPQQGEGYAFYYTMKQVKDVAYCITKGDFSFKGVGVASHTWNEAFGDTTQGVAQSYLLDDINASGATCATLGFSSSATPEVEGIELKDLHDVYFNNSSFWGNSANTTSASCYGKKEHEGSFGWYNDNRTKTYNIVALKSFSNSVTLHFNRGIGVSRICNKDYVDITQDITIKFGSNFNFRVECFPGYDVSAVTANGQVLTKDSEEHYNLSNIMQDINIDVKTTKLNSLTYEGNRYYPVINEDVSDKDIVFYKGSEETKEEIKASGKADPTDNNHQFYLMSDLKEATYYRLLNDNAPSFTAVRSSQDVHWDTVFEHSIRVNTTSKQAFGGLNEGDSVFIFNPQQEDRSTEPKIHGIGISNIYKNYQKDKRFTSVGHIWANWQYDINRDLAYYFNCQDNKFYGYDDMGPVNYDEPNVNVLITRQFNAKQVSVNLNKDSSQYIDKFVDDKGNELPSKLMFDKNSSFRFKVVPVEGRTIRQVQIGTKVLRPDKDGFYYVLNLTNNTNIIAKASKISAVGFSK